jgi:hypothetical protein
MRRISVFVIVLAFGVGAAATLGKWIRQDASFRINRVNKDAGKTTNGAFRDGLYQGQLAATRGSEPHIATGRWAADQDRASFTEGYQQGYAESLAVRASAINSFRRSE